MQLEDFMKRLIARSSAAAILSLFGAAHAAAAEYTFLVPIAFKELPTDVRELEVLCSVHLGTGPTYALLGENTARRPVAARAFSGEVRVEVARRSGETRRPTGWACGVSLVGQVDGRQQFYLPAAVSAARPNEYRYNPNIPSAPGTPVVIRTSGDLK
jgi:hypothetical protein